MSSLSEIEKQIEQLSVADFWKLAEWIEIRKNDAWDRQMEADVGSGRLDYLIREAGEEFDRGEARPLDEIF